MDPPSLRRFRNYSSNMVRCPAQRRARPVRQDRLPERASRRLDYLGRAPNSGVLIINQLLVFLGFSWILSSESGLFKGLRALSVGKKNCMLLAEVTRAGSVKHPGPRPIAHSLMTHIVVGILIFSKEFRINIRQAPVLPIARAALHVAHRERHGHGVYNCGPCPQAARRASRGRPETGADLGSGHEASRVRRGMPPSVPARRSVRSRRRRFGGVPR
jgi:hypothetical protein